MQRNAENSYTTPITGLLSALIALLCLITPSHAQDEYDIWQDFRNEMAAEAAALAINDDLDYDYAPEEQDAPVLALPTTATNTILTEDPAGKQFAPKYTETTTEITTEITPAPADTPADGNESDLYTQMLRRNDIVSAELQKMLYELDDRDVPELPARVLSIRKNATVTIGGEIRAHYALANAKGEDPGFDPKKPNKGKYSNKTGDLALNTARIMVDARIAQRWRVFADLNLNGHYGLRSRDKLVNPNTPGAGPYTDKYDREDDTDFLNQAYIELMKGDHSGLGFILGRIKMPFGLWNRPNLFAQSFLDAPNLDGSYLMNPDGSGMLLPHASRFIDPVMAAMINYEIRDIIRFEAAVFQDKDQDKIAYARRDGSTRVRTESPLPRSWQVGLSLQPLEGWELTAHFRNRYSRSQGLNAMKNSPMRWDFRENMASGTTEPKWDATNKQWSDAGDGVAFGSRTNEQALVIGLAAEIPNTKLAASIEYAHGWNQGFNKYVNSDSVNVGLAYKATPRLTLHAQGEWLHIKDRSWMAEKGAGWARDTRNHHLYRLMLGAEYELADRLTLEAGWQYEYWKARSSILGDTRTNRSNMFYIGTRFVF